MKIFCQFLIGYWFSCSMAYAVDISGVLSGEQPEGIVFDITSGDETLLHTLLPEIKLAIKKIRKTYPEMALVIVTHGDEQFGLLSSNQGELPVIHTQVKDLVNKQDVAVHVCGTYADWHDYTSEDFPDYVDVAASGPAQVNDYRALGYTVIQLP